MNSSDLITPILQNELVEFAQNLVRIKSYSGQEREVIKFIDACNFYTQLVISQQVPIHDWKSWMEGVSF
jgi:hypothetical protein